MINSLYRLLNALGFTDPIHPPMTHIPIGLVIGAFVFFAVAVIFKRRQLVLTARYVSILALIFVFPTILFGVFDWIHFYHGVPMTAIKVKMVLAAVLIVLLVVGIVLGGRAKPHNGWMMIIYALSLLTVVGLGYFGAGIIYGRGTRTAEVAAAPAVISVAAPARSVPADASDVPGNATAGRELFANNCEGCHVNGGNVIVASRPIRGSGKLASLNDFVAFIRKPTMPDGSRGSMPPFPASALSVAQARDLYAYVTRAWK
ncbi:MAG: DUF2231 domain-containing protein [Rectinemataceae bacterium]